MKRSECWGWKVRFLLTNHTLGFVTVHFHIPQSLSSPNLYYVSWVNPKSQISYEKMKQLPGEQHNLHKQQAYFQAQPYITCIQTEKQRAKCGTSGKIHTIVTDNNNHVHPMLVRNSIKILRKEPQTPVVGFFPAGVNFTTRYSSPAVKSHKYYRVIWLNFLSIHILYFFLCFCAWYLLFFP